MDIHSGRRKQIRLELDKDIFKTITINSEDFIGAKLIDISHFGMGLSFDDGVSGLFENQKITFTIQFNTICLTVRGVVRHAGTKFVGIQFIHFSKDKEEFFSYLDSRIIAKYKIREFSPLRGAIQVVINHKITILLLLIEAIFFFFLFYYFGEKNCNNNNLQRFLEGNNEPKEIHLKTT